MSLLTSRPSMIQAEYSYILDMKHYRDLCKVSDSLVQFYKILQLKCQMSRTLCWGPNECLLTTGSQINQVAYLFSSLVIFCCVLQSKNEEGLLIV